MNRTEALERLKKIVEEIPPKFYAIGDEEWNVHPQPEKWNKKQILGHLTDSAANNHHRFIRARYEKNPQIFYDPDHWVNLSHYAGMDHEKIIRFWTEYNRFICAIIENINPEDWSLSCNSTEDSPTDLDFIFTDYVTHLEHHLAQIIDYQS